MSLKIGYFGFGKSTNRYHLPYVLIRDKFEVKTICSPVIDEQMKQRYIDKNITFTSDEDILLKDEEIELVVVCTPPSSHFELAKKALLNNKNVLVEKPFCPKFEEAVELLELAKEKGLFCIPFQNRRFDGDFLAVKNVIESGKLGDIIEVESHFDYYRPEYPDFNGEYYDGAFYGLGVHTIDQMISIFKKPDHVYYDIRTLRNSNNPDDTFEVNLFYKDCKVIVKTSHLVKIDYPKFIVHGKKGSFVKYGIDQQETCLKAGIMPQDEGFGLDQESAYGTLSYINEQGEDVIEKVQTPLGDYGRVYDAIYNHIKKGEDIFVTYDEIMCVMEILSEGFKEKTPFVKK